jgi:hypothetical protein
MTHLSVGALLGIGLFTTTQPYPLILLEAGLITMVAGVVIGLPRCGCAACTWR